MGYFHIAHCTAKQCTVQKAQMYTCCLIKCYTKCQSYYMIHGSCSHFSGFLVVREDDQAQETLD